MNFYKNYAILAKTNFKAVDAAKYCEESIRDAFINGISSKMIRQRLLDDATLDLKSVFTKARTLDLAQKSSELYSSMYVFILLHEYV